MADNENVEEEKAPKKAEKAFSFKNFPTVKELLHSIKTQDARLGLVMSLVILGVLTISAMINADVAENWQDAFKSMGKLVLGSIVLVIFFKVIDESIIPRVIVWYFTIMMIITISAFWVQAFLKVDEPLLVDANCFVNLWHEGCPLGRDESIKEVVNKKTVIAALQDSSDKKVGVVKAKPTWESLSTQNTQLVTPNLNDFVTQNNRTVSPSLEGLNGQYPRPATPFFEGTTTAKIEEKSSENSDNTTDNQSNTVDDEPKIKVGEICIKPIAGTQKVYVQFAGALNRDSVVMASEAIHQAKWKVQGSKRGGERTAQAAGLNEVRYFHEGDKTRAMQLAYCYTKKAIWLGGDSQPKLKTGFVEGYESVPIGQLEVWTSVN